MLWCNFGLAKVKYYSSFNIPKKANPNYDTLNYYLFKYLFDYPEMKDRKVLGMDGYGGQSILIDFERSRIVVVNAIHKNYSWKKIVYQRIKKGE